MNLNAKIKDLRLKHNLTIDQLAKKLNVNFQTIVSWEQGTIEPSISEVKELSTLFNVSVSYLINQEEDPYKTKQEKLIKVGEISFLVVAAFTIFSVLISFIILKIMKDIIPVHFGINGNITRYGSKYESLVIAGSNILFFINCLGVYLFAKNNIEYKTNIFITNIVLLITIICFIFANIVWGLNTAKDLNNDLRPALISTLFAILVVLHIFILPKFNKTNMWFGFRTPFTLKNKDAWEKINYFYGISGIASSLIAYIFSLILFNNWSGFLLILVFVGMIPSIIYHEKLQKEANNS